MGKYICMWTNAKGNIQIKVLVWPRKKQTNMKAKDL